MGCLHSLNDYLQKNRRALEIRGPGPGENIGGSLDDDHKLQKCRWSIMQEQKPAEGRKAESRRQLEYIKTKSAT